MTIQYTPNYQIPYPQLTDTPDVPRDVAAVANRLDTVLGQQIPLSAPVGAVYLWFTPAPPTGWAILKGASVDVLGANNPGLKTMFGVNASDQVLLPDCRNTFLVGAGSNYTVGQKQDASGKAGSDTVGLTTAQLPAHNHGVTDPGHSHTEQAAGSHSHGGATGGEASPDHLHGLPNWSIYNATSGQSIGFASGANQFFRSAAIATAGADRGLGHAHSIGADGSHTHVVNGAATGISTQNTGSASGNANLQHENRPPFIATNFIIKLG